MNSKLRSAQCMCGALGVITTGEPVRVSICHCLDCQVRSGSAFAFQARWPDEAVQIRGEPATFVRDHDDGDQARFHFCRQCGSHLFYQTNSQPGLTAIAVGGFADPKFPAPHYSVFEERKHRWLVISDEGIDHYD